ncbi:LytTR family DNA-binding domain-containing protein [Pedobacter jeongneungensis]|uniref:LytTR family DNA-binding domain-containing protein n=1 Tax=Pedobacter jeongneungensis TaxID=947309 RepID=A0ABP8B228_9SPHI
MQRCIIVDDEIHAIETLKDYIHLMPELNLIGTYNDPINAMRTLGEHGKVDLILMDINMPRISGLELAKQVRTMTNKLIFTTAHTKYGFEAFGVNANDYLLKPISLAVFMSTIDKIFPSTQKPEEPDNSIIGADDFFFIKSREDNLKLIRIIYSDVVAIESNLNYINIHTKKKSILTYMSLSEIAKSLLGKGDFVQFQRSFIINKNYIDDIDGNSIKMVTGLKMTVGEYYKKDFNKFISEHVIRPKRRN